MITVKDSYERLAKIFRSNEAERIGAAFAGSFGLVLAMLWLGAPFPVFIDWKTASTAALIGTAVYFLGVGGLPAFGVVFLRGFNKFEKARRRLYLALFLLFQCILGLNFAWAGMYLWDSPAAPESSWFMGAMGIEIAGSMCWVLVALGEFINLPQRRCYSTQVLQRMRH